MDPLRPICAKVPIMAAVCSRSIPRSFAGLAANFHPSAKSSTLVKVRFATPVNTSATLPAFAASMPNILIVVDISSADRAASVPVARARFITSPVILLISGTVNPPCPSFSIKLATSVAVKEVVRPSVLARSFKAANSASVALALAPAALMASSNPINLESDMPAATTRA